VSAVVAAVPVRSGAELDCCIATALPTGHPVVPPMTLLLKVDYFLVSVIVRAEVLPVRVGSCELVILVDAAAVVSWPGPVEEIATFQVAR